MQNKEILKKLSLIKTEEKFGKNYKGLLIKVSGRLKGAQRARKLQVYHGRISTQTFNSTINYSQRQIFTK
jgi:ribosomal protein S3